MLFGVDPVRVPPVRDLQDNPELWARVWRENRAELLKAWISESPGSRPPAFWDS